jgi:hypothetical protein
VSIRRNWLVRAISENQRSQVWVGDSRTFSTPFVRWGAVAALLLLIASFFSCGGGSPSGVSANVTVRTANASTPSTSLLDCQSSQCISLPVVPQTSHRFQFWYEFWDPGTTPEKLAWADVVIGLNGITPTAVKASVGAPQVLPYVTYYQDTYNDVGGVSRTLYQFLGSAGITDDSTTGEIIQHGDFPNSGQTTIQVKNRYRKLRISAKSTTNSIGISVLVPDSPTLYTLSGVPAHIYFSWPGPGSGTESCLPQRESRNC